MVFPIAGGNQDTSYEISNSLRFDRADSALLSRSPSSSGNRQILTISAWFKLGTLTNERVIIAADDGGAGNTGGNNNFDYIAVNGNRKLFLYNYESNEGYQFISNQTITDPSAWYHIVAAFDTTQGTNTNRLKIYLNGNQITSWATSNYPDQNRNLLYNHTGSTTIGRYPDQAASFFDGYMSDVNVVDGQQLDPTYFGNFNPQGIWTPKEYTGSYGTNGFFLEFKQTGTSQNSSGIGADTSGNDHHFAVTNLASTDVTIDTPTNNFATANPAVGRDLGNDIKNGNLTVPADASGDIITFSTQSFKTGKWYMEAKSTVTNGHGNRKTLGVISIDSEIDFPRIFSSSSPYDGVVVDLRVGDVYRNGSDTSVNISTFSNGDIVGLAYDADEGKLEIHKNGTYLLQDSDGVSALDLTKEYLFYLNQDGGGSNAGNLELNFGVPSKSFSISSGNADGNGFGNFEYAPPSGYLALCTKNLAETG
mgnify:CR=1 FL=1